MGKANSLLFEVPVDGQMLFKNQQELVNLILQQPGTEYYVTPDDSEKYARGQNRLKAYVSQLLSSNVVRNITSDFEAALLSIIKRKVTDQGLAERLVIDIINDLKSKNVATPKADSKSSVVDQLALDFKNGKYISIITARPLEVEAEISNEVYSLRKLVFEDFFDSITNPEKTLKIYRFNFPVDSSGHLFWTGINKLLVRYIKQVPDKKGFLDIIKHKIAFDFASNTNLFAEPDLAIQDVNLLAEKILRGLRKEHKLMVFTCDAPIFTQPLIIIDPAEIKNAKIYSILDSQDGNFTVHKFSSEEVVLWRLFVWDKMQSPLYKGKSIELDNI